MCIQVCRPCWNEHMLSMPSSSSTTNSQIQHGSKYIDDYMALLMENRAATTKQSL